MARKIRLESKTGVIESEVNNGDLILLGRGRKGVDVLKEKKAISKEEGEVWHKYPASSDYHIFTLPEITMKEVKVENRENYVFNALSELVLPIERKGFGIYRTMNSIADVWKNGEEVEIYGFADKEETYMQTEVFGSKGSDYTTLDIKLSEDSPDSVNIERLGSYKEVLRYGNPIWIKISDNVDGVAKISPHKIKTSQGTEISFRKASHVAMDKVFDYLNSNPADMTQGYLGSQKKRYENIVDRS